jgi:hypothetical protein
MTDFDGKARCKETTMKMDAGGRVILRWADMDCIDLAEDSDQ